MKQLHLTLILLGLVSLACAGMYWAGGQLLTSAGRLASRQVTLTDARAEAYTLRQDARAEAYATRKEAQAYAAKVEAAAAAEAAQTRLAARAEAERVMDESQAALEHVRQQGTAMTMMAVAGVLQSSANAAFPYLAALLMVTVVALVALVIISRQRLAAPPPPVLYLPRPDVSRARLRAELPRLLRDGPAAASEVIIPEDEWEWL